MSRNFIRYQNMGRKRDFERKKKTQEEWKRRNEVKRGKVYDGFIENDYPTPTLTRGECKITVSNSSCPYKIRKGDKVKYRLLEVSADGRTGLADLLFKFQRDIGYRRP